MPTPVAAGQWRYVGRVDRVGTGFSDALPSDLSRRLKQLEGKTPPVTSVSIAERETGKPHWVEPQLVAKVSYRDISGLGLLRQAAFKTLREDKTVKDLEPTVKAAAKTETKTETETGTGTGTGISHPDRVVFPDIGLTKADVAAYYRQAADALLAGIGGRPLSVLRCPDGIEGQHFFQKHLTRGMGEHVHSMRLAEKSGTAELLMVDSAAGIAELVQMNVIEFHPWGAPPRDPEHCGRLIFDLDPAPGLPFARVVEAARMLRERLRGLGLESFVRTSGGKGLHVVVPLNPAADWGRAKQFAHAMASACAQAEPQRYVDVASKAQRDNRIFIDYLRNGRGATSVASWSLRARRGAPVAMPLRWDELGRLKHAAQYDARSAPARLKRWRKPLWPGFESCRQSLKEAVERLQTRKG